MCRTCFRAGGLGYVCLYHDFFQFSCRSLMGCVPELGRERTNLSFRTAFQGFLHFPEGGSSLFAAARLLHGCGCASMKRGKRSTLACSYRPERSSPDRAFKTCALCAWKSQFYNVFQVRAAQCMAKKTSRVFVCTLRFLFCRVRRFGVAQSPSTSITSKDSQ